MTTLTERIIELATAIAADISELTDGKVSQVNNQLQGPLEPATPVTISATATMDIGAADSNLVLVTWIDGGDPVTSLGAGPVGAVRTLIFDGAVTFVQDPAKILLLDAFDMGAVAGTVATFRCVSAGLWQCLSWDHGFGAPVRGSPYQTIPDYIDPTVSNLIIYGGAQQYGQPAAIVFGSGSAVTYLQGRTPTALRHIWMPDKDGDLFITPVGTEDPGPAMLFPAKAGRYLTAPYNTLEAGAVVSGKTYFSVVYLRQPTTINQLGFTVTTEAEPESTARVGLYRVAGGNLIPRILSSPVAIDVPGDVVYDFPPSLIVAGVYVVAVRCSAVCSINFDASTAGSAAAMAATHGSASPTEAAGTTTQLTHTAASLPATNLALTALSYGAGLNPHLWAKT